MSCAPIISIEILKNARAEIGFGDDRIGCIDMLGAIVR